MKYSVLICFVSENHPDLVSKGIMAAEHSNFSHTLNIFEDMDGKRKIFHMVEPTACVDETMAYLNTHTIMDAFEVQMARSQDFVCGYIRGREGSGEYSYSQYSNHVARILFGISQPFIKNGDQKRVCSEESFDLLRWSDISHDPDVKLDADGVSPLMLHGALIKTDARRLTREEIAALNAK